MKGPDDWINAAIDALAEEGEAGVAIEPLARRLGVTKGSFYWHFKDRDALWTALLAAYEHQGTDEIVRAVSAIPDPEHRLRALFSAAWESPARLRSQRALSGTRRADVQTCMARVHTRRIAFLVDCYAALGCDNPAHRAATAYALYLGALQLSDRPPFDTPEALRAWVAGVDAVLIRTP